MEKEEQLLSRTLEALRPNAEYVLSGNDIKNIVWVTSDVKAVTQAEYDAEYKKQSDLYAENEVKAAIDQAISDLEGSKTRMREAYDSTYSYKSGGSATPTAAPGKPAATLTVGCVALVLV